jgi:hypothetical protein
VFGFRHEPAPGSGLHQCAVCRAECVVPVWWESLADEQGWHMLLRCGACATFRDVSVPNEVAQAYERDLRRGTAEIRDAVERMDRERMALETDAFITALRRDLIDAGDFAGR